MRLLQRILAFWYDFFVGDDWVLAAGTVLLVVAMALLASGPAQAFTWLAFPVGVVLVLVLSLWRAASAR